MRALLLLSASLLLAACSKDAAAPAGNEQAVIDKANADVMAAEAAAGPAQP
jgi:outer membrane biogenesis lipoprotein LolB